MNSRYRSLMAVTAIVAAMALSTPPAHAQDQHKYSVKTGYLTCHVSAGWGFIFGSSRSVKCTYSHGTEYSELYTGSINKFGADIGYLKSAVMLWAVLAPTNSLGKGVLAGHYGGATASVALGVGAGANVLVGGFKKSIALQPISIEGQNGLNVAAGVEELTLKFEKREPAK
jgi:hypothetical protein